MQLYMASKTGSVDKYI